MLSLKSSRIFPKNFKKKPNFKPKNPWNLDDSSSEMYQKIFQKKSLKCVSFELEMYLYGYVNCHVWL